MYPFAYARAEDAMEAIAAHADDMHLAFVAGGTDLFGLMKDRATRPDRPITPRTLPSRAILKMRPGYVDSPTNST